MNETPAEDGTVTRAVPFISRVRLRNYKSIAECDVRLGPLALLVGPNAAGKSNFLDALAFMSRAVATSPVQALDEHGGLDGILRQVPQAASSFSIAVEITVPSWPTGQDMAATYEIEIGRSAESTTGITVLRESCEVHGPRGAAILFSGRGSAELTPAADRPPGNASLEPDRLYLPVAGTQEEEFAQLYSDLIRFRCYHFRTDILRRPQRSSQSGMLSQRGEGIGDVLTALAADHSPVMTRVNNYLGAIAQGVTGIEAREIAGYKALALNTNADGAAFEFGSESMSEGTIRAAAVLAALFQPEALEGRLPLIGIEEPEIALHPAAAGVLFDALTEASEHVQVIATSQSADLLDREDLDPSAIRPVTMRDGLTIIGEVDDTSQEIVRQKLYTLGELMRGNQLSPQAVSEAGPSA